VQRAGLQNRYCIYIQLLCFCPALFEAALEGGLQMKKVIVLGTGGTIAGTSATAADNIGYTAAQVGVAQLVQAVPALAGVPIEVQQVAQVDSKDMTHAVWRALAHAVQQALQRADVQGVVVTHGTDTLEETAYLLHRVLAPAKPVVLTAAMRPASSSQADGPHNLLDAVTVARIEGAHGVVACANGAIWPGAEVRKTHTYRLDAFTAGDAGPIGWVEEGAVRRLREWPGGEPLGLQCLDTEVWPDVQIVMSHAGADGRMVDWLVQAGVQGIVVAATGNGTIHREIEAALLQARARGVELLRATRVGAGVVLETADAICPGAGSLTPGQARVELLLQLLERQVAAQ
jgi:L-asparaginase